MSITKENYQINATEMNGLTLRLNSILARISDRLDKIEGFRGELETASGTFTGPITTTKVSVTDSEGTQVQAME